MHLMGTEIPGVYSEVLLYSNYYPHNEIKSSIFCWDVFSEVKRSSFILKVSCPFGQ